MLIETRQMVPITRLQKELTQTVRELSDSGNPVYILKNNNAAKDYKGREV
jgi:hypothetical protein